jgi:hypothetical protein
MHFTGQHSVVSKPPCLKNWVFPLRELIYLTPKLFAANFTKFAPRFNKDPVENFFLASGVTDFAIQTPLVLPENLCLLIILCKRCKL